MAALELLSGFATAAPTGGVAVTVASGNSLTIRNGSNCWLLDAWADVQSAGFFRIRSPLLHDNVQGIRFRTTVSEVCPLLPKKQRLEPQDTLIVEVSGAAVAGDIESVGMLVYYGSLPGADARFISVDQLEKMGTHVLTVENTLALGTSGGYSGEEAINADFDLLKANVDYALVGYHVDLECASVRWRGTDFGGLGVGGPGWPDDKEVTCRWFQRLSNRSGFPLIPVLNSSNKAGILVDGVQDENGTDVTVTSILVELAPGKTEAMKAGRACK